MSVLASTSRAALPTELGLLAYSMMMHTSASLNAYKYSGSKPQSNSQAPSRTRLAKDLKPRGAKSTGRLEVAPKKPSFVRDAAPHPEARGNSREHSWRQPRNRLKGVPIRVGRPGQRKPWQADIEVRERQGKRTGESENQVAENLRTTGGLPKPRLPPLKIVNPLSEEFDLTAMSASTAGLPTHFTSPPLMEGLLSSVQSVLGPSAKPTPIQSLSLKHLFSPLQRDSEGQTTWRQYLLASETGSGKSMAYLLPMLQDLKSSELTRSSPAASSDAPKRALNPRALVLAPTHELSRQLSGFAKSLLHNIKLRVLCASRANVASTDVSARRNASASQMAVNLDVQDGDGEFILNARGVGSTRDLDVLVGTPTKMLEMVRGRGWDWEKRAKEREEKDGKEAEVRRKWNIGEPEAGLANVEWVVIDEADVLLDPDFQESTRMLLADIAAARGQPVDFQAELKLSSTDPTTSVEAPKYPFNLLLTTATIPSSLATYLDAYHPSLTRLASPHLHKLPSTLKTEYESWTGGRKNKDIERKIKRIWWEDAIAVAKPGTAVSSETLPIGSPKSKILIFCNKSSKVEDLGEYLTEMGIPNVALTSTSETRQRGNNHHLDGFLRAQGEEAAASVASDDKQPHVLITTSLLSRGLDFSPSIKHVFIVDSPRNMVDFLHRAGRSGRAGEKGKVVVFGKEKGRGAGKDKDMKSRVRALV